MAPRKTVFMFSGQGSQYFQMGRTLYQTNATFRSWMERMDAVARDATHCSILDVLYNDERKKTEVFDQAPLSSPAIFMVEYALAQTLIESGIVPDLTLGTSMGAFAAAAVAGCLDVETALRAAVTQAQLIAQHCPRGAMVAVHAEPRHASSGPLRAAGEIAAYNFDKHFVLALPAGRMAETQAFLQAREIAFQWLPVAHAYHSRWIDAAMAHHQDYFRSLPYLRPQLPIVCCAQASVTHAVTADFFWKVARQPIRFQTTIEELERAGSYHYIDVGPSGTLATFLKYILPPTTASRRSTVLSPFGRELADFLSEHRASSAVAGVAS